MYILGRLVQSGALRAGESRTTRERGPRKSWGSSSRSSRPLSVTYYLAGCATGASRIPGLRDCGVSSPSLDLEGCPPPS
eukprot:5678090-Pyramimonas_sp.AAC.1